MLLLQNPNSVMWMDNETAKVKSTRISLNFRLKIRWADVELIIESDIQVDQVERIYGKNT